MSTEKTNLHPRNLDRTGYDFKELITTYPYLSEFVKTNEHGTETIDFSDPEAIQYLTGGTQKVV